ncbi:MAG: hypothetical protein ABSG94_06995 [Brevinematales bacterium]|jgi:hypothetical protein
MDIKRYLISAAAVFLCFAVIDFGFDSAILSQMNTGLKETWRAVPVFWLEPVIYFGAALIFVLIYSVSSWRKGVPWGIIYGLATGILVSGVLSFKQYSLYPIPLILSLVWFIEGIIQYIIAGIVTALILNRKER